MLIIVHPQYLNHKICKLYDLEVMRDGVLLEVSLGGHGRALLRISCIVAARTLSVNTKCDYR